MQGNMSLKMFLMKYCTKFYNYVFAGSLKPSTSSLELTLGLFNKGDVL